MSFEEWKRENSTTLQGKTDDQIWELYKQYEKGNITIDPIIEDISDKKTPSYLQQTNTANNIDMLGTTDFLTQIGVTTNNSTLTKAGLSTDMHIHDLRHIAATMMVESTNGDVEGVSKILGHSDTRVLSKTYNNMRKENKKNIIENNIVLEII